MAEIAVNLVTDKLIPLLENEVNLANDVCSQLVLVKVQLRLIRAYLKDADSKAEIVKTGNVVKEWVTQMREVSFHIEDVIDEYLYLEDNMLQGKDLYGVVGMIVCKIYDFLRSVIAHHGISAQLGEIEKKLEELNKAKEAYGLSSSASESSGDTTLHYLRQGALFVEDDQLVGVEPTKQVLTNWLLENGSRTVISVVGDGGFGKTTIVNKVFNEQKEKHFDCYAWVTVSQSLGGKNLLKTLRRRFYEEANDKNATKEISDMDNDTLVRKLREYLHEKSYMIVFDDVWEESFWGDVEYALPRGKGKIIITTRYKKVAEFCGRSGPIHVHDMEPLSPDDAWKLFCSKACPEGCPDDLKELSLQFVNKCNGLPLAIVAIAGLLSTKNKSVLEWKKVYDSLRSKLSSDPYLSSLHQVLSESYQDLSYNLKSCLLYFGLFPEDYSISCVRLVNLWIAEGFVENKENEGQTLEEVAEEYLSELIARNLVKVAKKYSYGRVRNCRVHDLMHNFILKKCEELKFCQVKKSEEFKLQEWTRRLSIDTYIDDVSLERSVANYRLTRSCFHFNITHDMPTSIFESLFSSFKLLVRLDCENTPLSYLPKAVGNLLHLKYLNLRNTSVEMIPKFIGKLKNLETLDLKNTYVRELPIEINKLTKLRLLLVYHTDSHILGVKLKEGIGHLRALQKLRMVDASDDEDSIIRELQNLKQMRHLGICMLNKENEELLCSAIESMTNLCTLAIKFMSKIDQVLHLESLRDPPQHLQRIYLYGRLEKLPNWISKLKNLARLRLYQSGLIEDPLPLLKDLSTLLEFDLWESYEGNELYFQKGWFMNLKVLKVGLSTLVTFKIDEGAMPHLQLLELSIRPETVQVPTHIQQLIKS
ncbi:disease resistance protein RPM1-like [Abrus precatorius]|uniref:Disease resistance protein RPM1-like n=1 Tax=Abrus precatorius TaxID=3816 RepID=A0A8B8K225_ABRPR|nr:disease resistance protein RPM1-like [Abrus precatorius]